MRRRWKQLAGAAVLTALVAVAGRAGAGVHVRAVTGNDAATERNCLRCHGPQGTVSYDSGLRHPDPRAMLPTPDGSLLYVACAPTHTVAVLDVTGRSLLRMLRVDGRPAGLALSPDGGTLCVSLSDADCVALVDTATHRVRARIRVGTGPAGMAFGAGGRLFVANARSRDVSIVDLNGSGADGGAEVGRVEAGREPFAVAATPDGATIAVVSRMVENGPPDVVRSSEVTLLDGATGRLRLRVAIPSFHQAEGAAFTPDGGRLLVPGVRVRNLLPITQVARGWVMSSVLGVVDVVSGSVSLLPLNHVNEGFPDPSDVAVSTDGTLAFVAAGGADRVAVIDAETLLRHAAATRPGAPERLSVTREYVRDTFDVGRNPRGLAVVASGAQAVLAVAERLDDAVAFFDEGGELLARVPLGPGLAEDAVHRGDAVFHDARYSFQASFSCRSCHPGGHTDGLTYDFDIDGVGRNPVLNRSLLGVKGTAPFKWIGLNPTLQRQCGPRFAMVLTRADPFPDAQLEDLVAYIESLPPPRPATDAGRIAGTDTGAVARGRRIFERTVRKDGTPIPPSGRCVTCHPPPHYTNRLKADVATRGPLDDHAEYDVPHLTGIASKAPYLHDGRAPTLEAIWTAEGVGDSHGTLTDLGKSDLNDLVQFLRGL